MNAALLAFLLMTADPTAGCCQPVDEHSAQLGLGAKFARHAHYYKRVYYGHYDRHPFDYRFQFDYPWHAGPSQSQWRIAPSAAAHTEPALRPELHAPAPIVGTRRVNIVAHSTPSPKGRTTLQLKTATSAW